MSSPLVPWLILCRLAIQSDSEGKGAMALDQPKSKGSADGEAFRPHAVQRRWLDDAQGKPIQVRLMDGKGLSGVLLAHDAYCLSLKQAERPEPILVYKQAIALLLHSKDQGK
jgi:sRNA-binding regulator protein Hfq